MDVKTRYLEVSLNNAPPEKKLQALLEGAVHFIMRARKHLAAGEVDEVHNNAIRAQNIYLELLCALDAEAGEWVSNLQGLYYLMFDILLDANVRKDDARFEEAQQIGEQIRNLWDEVIAQARTEIAPVAASSADPAAMPAQRLNVAG
ncbi:MAG: flagellar export chaperone FliS [bacterium]